MKDMGDNMDNRVLIQANKIIRRTRPAYLTNQICTEYSSKDFLEIAFLSKRCWNDIKGSCIMCDYGFSKVSHSNNKYVDEMKKIMNSHQNIKSLLLCTNGSFLNEMQISNDLLIEVLKVAGNSNVEEIQIETHYEDINLSKLETIKSVCNGKTVTIELGFETANQLYQDNIIMKQIDLNKIENTISKIQSYGFKVILNIMLGLPFLSTEEQLLDTFKSIKWAFNHNCRAVVFPINIKPYTLLWHMNKTGFYEPISHWLLIHLLSMFEADDLSNITIAWYGDRDEGDENCEEHTVFPLSCENCNHKLMKFYTLFNSTNDSKKRYKLLKSILDESFDCDCLTEFKKNFHSKNDENFDLKYKEYVEKLKEDFEI